MTLASGKTTSKRTSNKPGSRRMLFSLDESAIKRLQEMVEDGRYRSMSEAVRDALAIMNTLFEQEREGFDRVVLRDKKGRERVIVR